MIRRLVPLLLVPLALIANVLAADPWLRAFPVSVGAVPLLGAAALSVLVPAVTHRLGARLWLGAIVDVVALLVFLLFVVLHDPTGFDQIVEGLHHGPSQILTFALPLVSPRDLMVGPAVLIWVAGALAGECLARRWATLLPYVGILASFGLAYAGTQRAAGGDLTSVRLRETLLAGGLLAVLLLMRTAQAWVRQDEGAESTQADGVLPLRGFVTGFVTAAVVALAASLVVQANAFPKQAATPQRQPLIDSSEPLAPLQFIASLRPGESGKSEKVFSVKLDHDAPGYFGIANVDFYDGAGWSFDRTFRPSGGVLPGDSDSALTSTLTGVDQTYTIADGPLTTAPWIPTLYRAQRVTGASVDIDPASGMIVPSSPLSKGSSYTVRSGISTTLFEKVDTKTATADTSTPATDVQIPPTLRTTLDKLIDNFAAETGTPSQPALPFLQALESALQKNYSLSAAAQGVALGTRTPEPSSSSASSSSSSSSSKSSSSKSSSSKSSSSKSSPSSKRSGEAYGERPLTAKSSARKSTSTSTSKKPARTSGQTSASSSPSPSPSDTAGRKDLAGGTGFADVVASVLGQDRAGTPEQFATLVALVARELGVPSRVVTGFRVDDKGSTMLPAGSYDATTAQAWTWVEIPVVGRGWTVLDATPTEFSSQSKPPDTGASATPTPSDTPSQALISEAKNSGHAVAPKTKPDLASDSSKGNGLLVALLLAGGAVVLLLVLLLLARKPLRRRRRRNAPEARAQVLGAWHESLDMLTESGLPELTTMTSAEIAELAGEQFGSAPREHTEQLGRAANAAAYSATLVIERPVADEAWASERALRKAVRGQLPLPARIAAAARYHRRSRAAAVSGPASWAGEAAARAAAERSSGRGRLSRRYQGRRRR